MTWDSRSKAAGQIDVDKKSHADMALSLGIGKEQFISVKISEVDILDLLRLAAQMGRYQGTGKPQWGEDALTFRDIKLYFSTGAKEFDVYYEHGIHVRGNMELFTKIGYSDGCFNDDGVTIKAGVDNSNLGGLEVASAKGGGKQASLEVEMSKERRLILID